MNIMNSTLGYRLKLGVAIPSTNTSVQPEMDAMRPLGVVNHIGRMLIDDNSLEEEVGFNSVIQNIRQSTKGAIQSLSNCSLDGMIIGVSPDSYCDGELTSFSPHIIESKHVIAINQQVYKRSSGGLSFISQTKESWRSYIDLGRVLQVLQLNDIGIGLMSSGYSSKSGNDLATAKRISDILVKENAPVGPSYFCVIGGVSAEQRAHEGMREDAVHLHGPAEIIRNDLLNILPSHMVPSKVAVLNSIPHSSSGKVDIETLKKSFLIEGKDHEQKMVLPKNDVENTISKIWCQQLNLVKVSTQDNFFEIGGDSLEAVAMVLEINKIFSSSLPIQVLFESPTIEALAKRIDSNDIQKISRIVPLSQGVGNAVFCWPGLGGYPMNLRKLAMSISDSRPILGVQAQGINAGETICHSIIEMAKNDIAIIKKNQPKGPYSLLGYSFGARVAYETAYQLEQMGDIVDELILIAPGSPKLAGGEPICGEENELFKDASFLTILFSVFAHTIEKDKVEPVIQSVSDKLGFITYIDVHYPSLDRGLIERIVDLVTVTYSPSYGIAMYKRLVKAPMTLFKASGDSQSFIEATTVNAVNKPLIVTMEADHYNLLQAAGVQELIKGIQENVGAWQLKHNEKNPAHCEEIIH